MMALETCHASVAFDIEGANLALVSFSLSSNQEENVTVVPVYMLFLCQLALSFWEILLIHPVNTSTKKYTICLTESETWNTSTS